MIENGPARKRVKEGGGIWGLKRRRYAVLREFIDAGFVQFPT